MSTRLGRPRLGERTLSRDDVVDRALALADAEGVEALTMRRLGRELGVEAMALYTHVDSKSDLLSAVGSRILSHLEIESRERSDWRGRIETVCRAWAALRELHPRSFALIYRGADAMTDVTEELMDALLTAGFEGADAWLAYQTLVFFLDPPLLHWPSAPPGEVWPLDLGGPIQRSLAPFAQGYRWDDVWENGLAVFLDGLASRLPPAAHPHRAGA